MRTKEQLAAYARSYRLKNIDKMREYKKNWNRQKRGTVPKDYKTQPLPSYKIEELVRKYQRMRDVEERAKELEIRKGIKLDTVARNIKLLSTMFGLSEDDVVVLFPRTTLHKSKLSKKSYGCSIWSGMVIPNVIRQFIFMRDNYCCQYCGKNGIIKAKGHINKDTLCIDHKNAIGRFGIDHRVSNLITACISCNSAKCAKTYEEYVSLKV